ncbi:MAG: peptide-binding protein [Phycisphaerae bacterium]|jgi:peptide/nickel transport system substrate-binding protein
MNGRAGVYKFFVFLFLLVIITFQFLSMIQSDRLYERLGDLVRQLESAQRSRPVGLSGSIKNGVNQTDANQGDWLVWHDSGEPRTLNPISVDSSMEARHVVQRNIFETLFYYDLDYDGVKLEPVLAEKMEISDDGLEVTVTLKEDIWFSDGQPVTADDVIFTYRTIMDPKIDAADIRNYYNNFVDAVKLDDRTVLFKLKEVFWKTIESIGIFEVLPEHIYKYDNAMEFNNWRTNPIGSGPYVFERWDVGQQIVLTRNENYWGEKPNIKKIVFKYITNATAALQALKTGDVDYMEPSSEQFYEVNQDEAFKEQYYTLSYWEPSGGYAFIGWNEDTPYFSDRRVRLAMTHLIDRESMVEHLLKGLGRTITGTFYIYGKQNDPNISPWPYDPQRAAELLDEAGWTDSDGDGIRNKDGIKFSFKLSYPAGNDTAERVVKLIKDTASQAGVEVIPDPVEWSIYLRKMHDRDITAGMSGWGGTIESDPYQLFHSSQVNGGSNYYGFRNKEADALIESARRELDPEKRYAKYHEFCRLLHREQPYTFMYTRPTYGLFQKRFKNVKVHSLGVNHLEWYVPKDEQRYR